jgi:hypothetical protein
MLSLVIIWLLIGLACLPAGKFILNLMRGDIFASWDDRLVVCLWLGFIFHSNLLLLLSQFMPLTPIVGVGVLLLSLLLGLLALTQPELSYVKQAGAYYFALFLLVILFTVPISAQTVIWLDTDGYQYPVIKWLANYGTVKGLGLLHIRFAHMPTATTINALFDHGICLSRTSTIGNGFMSLLLLLHFCTKIGKLFSNKQHFYLSDWFVIWFAPCIYISAAYLLLLRSANPDLGIMYLTGVLVWLMLVSSEQSRDQHGAIGRLAVYLGVSAITLKLNALPLGVGAILFYIYHYRQKLTAIIWCLLLCGLGLIPCFLYGWRTSGCPLFPASIGCGGVDWGFTLAEVKNYSHYIYDFNFNFSLMQFQEHPLLLLVPLLVIPAALYVGWQATKLKHLMVGMLLVGNLLSIVFIIVFAPALRFGIGYGMAIVSLAMSLYTINLASIITRKLPAIHPLMITVFILFILLEITLRDWHNLNWLLPPILPPADRVIVKRAVNFFYNFPDNQLGLCGSTALPCGVDNLEKVKLIAVDRGIGGGFTKQN